MGKDCAYEVGTNYFIRTKDMMYTGTLQKIYQHELVFVIVSWILDTGPITKTLITGDFREVDPYPENCQVIITRESAKEMIKIDFPLPREVKKGIY